MPVVVNCSSRHNPTIRLSSYNAPIDTLVIFVELPVPSVYTKTNYYCLINRFVDLAPVCGSGMACRLRVDSRTSFLNSHLDKACVVGRLRPIHRQRKLLQLADMIHKSSDCPSRCLSSNSLYSLFAADFVTPRRLRSSLFQTS